MILFPSRESMHELQATHSDDVLRKQKSTRGHSQDQVRDKKFSIRIDLIDQLKVILTIQDPKIGKRMKNAKSL